MTERRVVVFFSFLLLSFFSPLLSSFFPALSTCQSVVYCASACWWSGMRYRIAGVRTGGWTSGIGAGAVISLRRGCNTFKIHD